MPKRMTEKEIANQTVTRIRNGRWTADDVRRALSTIRKATLEAAAERARDWFNNDTTDINALGSVEAQEESLVSAILRDEED